MTSQAFNQPSEWQMSFLEVSPVKTSAMQASKLASNKAHGLGCFTNSCESFAWYSPNTLSWKTSQQSLLTDSTLFSGRWPKQGTMQSGRAYALQTWGPVIAGTGGGLLPTPTAREHKDSGPNVNYEKLAKKSRLTGVLVQSCSAQLGKATYLNPCFVEEMMGYPVGWTDLNA
jgi:hypothetical protein